MAMAEELVRWSASMWRRAGNQSRSRVLRLPSAGRCDLKGMGSIGALRIQGPHLQQRGQVEMRKGEKMFRCVGQILEGEPPSQAREQTQYDDSWLDVAAIEFLTDRIGFISGKKTHLRGYDGFVDMTRKLVYGLPAKNQRDMIRDLLHVVLPDWLLFCFRIVPKTKIVKEFYAQFTMVFFRWLVGHCEIRETEVNAVLMKSTVHIKKCRYLENSQCVGLCVNLCKNPTEEFIGKQLGMPLTMNPNFEDMSCDMIYGLHPPPAEEDAAYQQPCYSLCKSAKTKSTCA